MSTPEPVIASNSEQNIVDNPLSVENNAGVVEPVNPARSESPVNPVGVANNAGVVDPVKSCEK